MIRCDFCNVEFQRDEYRAHVQTHFHEINEKRFLRHQRPLTYLEYAQANERPEKRESREVQQHHAQFDSSSCFVCAQRFEDPLLLLHHLNDVHFYQVLYFDYLKEPQALANQISYFAVQLRTCLACEQQFDTTQSLIRHIRTTSHSFVINELVDSYYDFTEMWPEEFRAMEGARSQPFSLFDKESVQRFRSIGIIGDYRKKKPYVANNALISRGLMLSGPEESKNSALAPLTHNQTRQIGKQKAYFGLLLIIFVLCLIFEEFQKTVLKK